jgi:hypothetical protein
VPTPVRGHGVRPRPPQHAQWETSGAFTACATRTTMWHHQRREHSGVGCSQR